MKKDYAKYQNDETNNEYGKLIRQIAFDYPSKAVGKSVVLQADCFEWLEKIPENSIHAIVTDPPYGVKEYDFDQLEKRANGSGGIWRLPPSFDGHTRSPLPRFTALNEKERGIIKSFFAEWSKLVEKVLRPGGHVIIATNAYLSQLVFSALLGGELEFRGELIRIVRTLRGGDRPKNAEDEFSDVSTLPRGCYEPWGVFRKQIPKGMRVSDCLRKYETGGLRRDAEDKPISDVIYSERTSAEERNIANHPSLKPQSFLRYIVRAVLPLGKGIVVDPFMGSGSTIAAAEAIGYVSIGIERHAEYYQMSHDAIPRLAALKNQIPTNGGQIPLEI